ncbi:MAG: GNAT family N-acetyltransferase [Planctomycetota bacterium]|nr:GNAT family N-acetyltransferase [Planctomycetota bacterium]
MRAAAPLLVLALASCAATDETPPTQMDPWSSDFEPPLALDTDRVHLEPLAGQHTEMDYAALMSSREHLQRTLGWGDWPRPDFTVEENRGDLERHWGEFEAREAYAYTVQDAARERCVGCIYMNPAEAEGDDAPGVRLAYWVTEPELESDLDRHVLEAVLHWVEEDWPFASLALVQHEENERGVRVAQELGLELLPESFRDNRILVWRRE